MKDMGLQSYKNIQICALVFITFPSQHTGSLCTTCISVWVIGGVFEYLELLPMPDDYHDNRSKEGK